MRFCIDKKEINFNYAKGNKEKAKADTIEVCNSVDKVCFETRAGDGPNNVSTLVNETVLIDRQHDEFEEIIIRVHHHSEAEVESHNQFFMEPTTKEDEKKLSVEEILQY